MRKDYQQSAVVTSMPKFEQLVVDINDDEPSRLNKIITPITSMNEKRFFHWMTIL